MPQLAAEAVDREGDALEWLWQAPFGAPYVFGQFINKVFALSGAPTVARSGSRRRKSATGRLTALGCLVITPSRVAATSHERSRVRFRERMSRRRRAGSSGCNGVKRSAHILGWKAPP